MYIVRFSVHFRIGRENSIVRVAFTLKSGLMYGENTSREIYFRTKTKKFAELDRPNC
jgi:hypothetical protein